MSSESEICRKQTKTIIGKDKISGLHDDLLLHILCLIPTKDAVTTMFLSKRWRFVWTLLPKLEYINGEKRLWNFIDKSLQLHKAPSLKKLHIEICRDCPAKMDVEKWVLNAVCRFVQELVLVFRFKITDDRGPARFPKSLYTCNTLVKLTLCGTIIVDVPSLPCLPSLESLRLTCVVYKDQDSHVKLLSSCPNLKDLFVGRNKNDNVTSFIVKVPSLQKFTYMELYDNLDSKPLVIDSLGLNYLQIWTGVGHNVLIKNLPRLNEAMVFCNGLNDKFMTCFSSVMFLKLFCQNVASWSAINFSRLIELELDTDWSDNWLEPLVLLLHNAPKLKALMITINENFLFEDPPVSWNQPSHVPVCLLSHLEIFQWKKFRGTSKGKQFLAWILANSKCLKKVGIKVQYSKNDDEEKKRIMEDELESMFRVSTSSQLMFTDESHRRYYRQGSGSR
ncbi:unnamed protein product [Cochlearia groenlandica]